MSKKVTVYSKPNCQQCEGAKKYLIDKGIKFEAIDVFDDDKALAMLRDEGYAQMPVVDINGVKHSGFRPDILKKIKEG